MKKINEFLEKYIDKIIIVMLILNPFIDLLTSIFGKLLSVDITFGVIIRFIFIGILVYYLLFVDKSKIKKRNIIYLLILFIYIIIFSLLEYNQKGFQFLFQEIKSCFKSFYFPIILLALYTTKNRLKKCNNLLLISMVEYLILLFIPLILNIGFESYEISKVGTIGFFTSANEISCIMGIICPFLILYLFQKSDIKGIIFKIILIIIYLYVIVSIGTKVPLLALFITCGLVFIWHFIKFIKEKKITKIVLLAVGILIVVGSGIFLLPKTNFYKNIKIHMNYLKIDSIGDVISDPEIIDHFVFSQRVKFYQDTNEIYKKVPLSQKLFGMGYIRGENDHTKLIEMDYYDIFYSHGIIGFIIYFYTIIYVLVRLFKNLKEKINFSIYINLISLILIFVLSLMSGHVMTSPAVSIYAGVIIMNLINCNDGSDVYENRVNSGKL